MTLYYISGGPNSGKSSLVKRLFEAAYLVVPESARYISNTDERFKGKKIHEIRSEGLMQDFQNEVFREQNKMLGIANGLEEDVFCDRGFVDSVVYYRNNRLEVPKELLALALKFKSTAFILELFDKGEDDSLRTETPEERREIHEGIIFTYEEFGYPIIRVPKMTVEERAKFVLEKVKNL